MMCMFVQCMCVCIYLTFCLLFHIPVCICGLDLYNCSLCVHVSLLYNHICMCFNLNVCVCDQDNIGELDSDRQEELKRARRLEEEEEEKGRKSALLFGSEDTFDLIASLEEKVCVLCSVLLLLLLAMSLLLVLQIRFILLLIIKSYHYLIIDNTP